MLRLHCEMMHASFERLDADHCVYVRKTHLGHSMIGVHIDDMAAAASNGAEMASLIRDLQKVLDLIDMGDVKWFLGMEITCDRTTRTMTLSQTAYINTIA